MKKSKYVAWPTPSPKFLIMVRGQKVCHHWLRDLECLKENDYVLIKECPWLVVGSWSIYHLFLNQASYFCRRRAKNINGSITFMVLVRHRCIPVPHPWIGLAGLGIGLPISHATTCVAYVRLLSRSGTSSWKMCCRRRSRPSTSMPLPASRIPLKPTWRVLHEFYLGFVAHLHLLHS